MAPRTPTLQSEHNNYWQLTPMIWPTLSVFVTKVFHLIITLTVMKVTEYYIWQVIQGIYRHQTPPRCCNAASGTGPILCSFGGF